MGSNEILGLDVTSLSESLRARKISSVEVTKAYLDRIAEVDTKLGSYLTVTADRALSAAMRADREISSGHWRGPFQGVPIGLKDNIYTRGVLTTAGSKVLGEFVPDFDATAWARLSAAGAVLLGKLNLNEFAFGGLNKTCRNPYALNRLPGGSSAGAAVATAGRTAAAALGSDTSGSIRIPASMCGCVGLKPTWSRVSRHGLVPLAQTMDHIGPMTRSVRDAAQMLNIIAGHDPDDATSSGEPVPDYAASLNAGIKEMRIGIIQELLSGLSPEVASLFHSATKQLSALGAVVEEVSIRGLEIGALINATVTWVEALEYHEQWLRERRHEYGAECRLQLETGMMIPAVSYVRAQRGRARILAQALKALEKHDVLVAPGAATTATKIRDQQDMGAKLAADTGYHDMLRFTQPFDATGQPAITIPSGLAANGLPGSIQIIGRPFAEEMVLRVAAAYEEARGPLPRPFI